MQRAATRPPVRAQRAFTLLLVLTLGSAPLSTTAQEATAEARAHALASAAIAVEEAARELLETLRIVVIPAHTRDRQELLGDVVGDTEEIHRVAGYLAKKFGGGSSDRHIQKGVHRVSRDFQDLKANAHLLAAPERFNQGVEKLGAAVQQLERRFTGG